MNILNLFKALFGYEKTMNNVKFHSNNIQFIVQITMQLKEYSLI